MAYRVPEYNPNVFSTKRGFVYTLIKNIRANGSEICWVLNKQNYEVYEFRVVQVSEFDIRIDLINALENELILSTAMVLHMKDKIIELFDEIPGKVYLNKLECYRELYNSLNEKYDKLKNKKLRVEIKEKIDYIESTFPELLI